MFLQKIGKIYVSIRDIAPLIKYEAHNGEYKVDIEDTNKMYVEALDETETTSFYLNSRIISKVVPNSTDDYQNITIDEPVVMINDKLYVISEGFTIGFNSLFDYDETKNRITIQTLPYLTEYYTTKVTEYGYSELSKEFNNQKALIYGMMVAAKESTKKYGVITTEGKEVISPRYNNIEFIENSGEFIITNSSEKVGIAYSTGKTKITVSYDEIKVIDSDLGFYLVKSNNKYGILDSSESFIVHIEYDQIGIDTSKFPADNIKNQYILYDSMIPVKLGKKWGFLDTKGNKITEVEYDDIGYMYTKKEKVANNVLAIGDTKVVVVAKGKQYGGVDAKGNELIPIRFDGIYSITTAGETEYYIIFNEKEYNALEYINAMKKVLGYKEDEEEIKAGIQSPEQDTNSTEQTENKESNKVDNNNVTDSNTVNDTLDTNTSQNSNNNTNTITDSGNNEQNNGNSTTEGQDNNNGEQTNNSVTDNITVQTGANPTSSENTQTSVAETKNEEVQAFNSAFSEYIGEKNGATAKSLISAVIVSNTSNGTNNQVVAEYNGTTYVTSESLSNLQETISTKENYKIDVEYNEGGYISKFIITRK